MASKKKIMSSSATLAFQTILVVSLMLAASSSSVSALIADDHVALFVFGDSLYDTGMDAIFKPKSLGTNKPYGETFFKKPTGRYCDGRVLPDFITEYAKLPYLPPYLKPGLTDYTNGVNFAVAGACVLSDIRPGTVNLKMQVDYFVQMVEKMKKQIGESESNKVLSKAVYLFSIGGNDYATLISTNIKKIASSGISTSYKRQYTNMVLANLTSHIQTIYNKGGRKFAFQNVGPIGCMPSTKQIYKGAGLEPGTCAKEPQTLVKTHNALFQTMIKNLQTTQLSGIHYSIFDSYATTSYRVVYSTKYGFKETNNACCGSGEYNGAFNCGSTTEKFSLCSSPNDYLWFDAAHPTDKANGQLAQMFWNGSSNVVAPNNLKSLFEMH